MSHKIDPRFVGDLELGTDFNNFENMIVAKDFGFIDSSGVRWDVHTGDVVNGASIPGVLKVVVGRSYQQPYLPAAVLHDVYSQSKVRPWRDTDMMFYEAMITNGVNLVKAQAMYWAVYLFGPHWSTAK